MPPRAKAAGKAKGPAKRKLAEEFPPGEVLTDTAKKSWRLGTPVGQGGFGMLYLASDDTTNTVGTNAQYVVKVEPSDNGPLFSELKFYMRAAKPDLISAWIKSHKLKYLGVPKYWGSGLHEKGGKRYRFMVMDRFGTDLQKLFEEGGKIFPRKLVLQLGLRLLDILEYIHEHEYVHADIKASNLLLSYKNPNQVYLVDYGLAYRYLPEGVPKEYKEDPKKCHDGTIEFTSIDAHRGVSPSRRGDLEILLYCMIQWLCGRLPWEDDLKNLDYVRDSKIRGREDIKAFMKSCFTAGNEPDELIKFLEVVKKLDYNEKPDYQKLRRILQQGLKSIGATDDDKLDFSESVAVAGPSSARTTKRKIAEEKEPSNDETDESPAKKRRPAPKKASKERTRKKRNGDGAVLCDESATGTKKKASAKKSFPKQSEEEASTSSSATLEVKRTRGRPKKTK